MQTKATVTELPLGQFVEAKKAHKESINGVTKTLWRKGEMLFVQGMYYPSPVDCPEIMLGSKTGEVESVSLLELEDLVVLPTLH